MVERRQKHNDKMNWKKQVLLNIENVYTASAFRSGDRWQVGAGSETCSEVCLYDMADKDRSLVTGCPGGVYDSLHALKTLIYM